MKKLIYRLLLPVALTVVSLSSCKKAGKNDPAPEKPIDPQAGDSENITRIEITLNSTNPADVPLTATYSYLAEGKFNADSLKLSSGVTYLAELRIYDDTKKPVAVVSDEIKEEANFHRFHYTFTASNALLNTTITDLDELSPAQPLGLTFTLQAAAKGTGIFHVSLRHFANGIPKNSDPNGGEQDLVADFPVKVY